MEQVVQTKPVAYESSPKTAIGNSEGSKSKSEGQKHTKCPTLPAEKRFNSGVEHVQRNTQSSRPWQNTRNRREITIPISPHPCTCGCLPGYFKRDGLIMPSLESFPAGKLEFMAHVEQISKCLGHSERLINGCRLVLELEKNAERVRGLHTLLGQHANQSHSVRARVLKTPQLRMEILVMTQRSGHQIFCRQTHSMVPLVAHIL